MAIDTILTHLGFYSPSTTIRYIERRIAKLKHQAIQHQEEIDWHTAMKKLCDAQIKKLQEKL